MQYGTKYKKKKEEKGKRLKGKQNMERGMRKQEIQNKKKNN